jgi:enoyl-[acyl-carrier protein] reductase I
VATALHVSAYSLKSLTTACRPMFGDKASVVGLTFDATSPGRSTTGWAWRRRRSSRPPATWPATWDRKACGSTWSPRTDQDDAAKSIPGFDEFEGVWSTRAPIGWDLSDPEPAARGCVALLSDWFPRTTGEIVHVDGGVHAMGA